MDKEINQIIEEFEFFTNWEDKYSYIIELGKKLTPLDTSQKIASNKIEGCISQVWLITSFQGGKYYFFADSDAFIVKGLLAIVLRIFSGKSKSDILNINFREIFDLLGLSEHLTLNRSNGLFAVVTKILSIASEGHR
jgi:cysteine desulfuration protein SufE